MRSLEPLPNVGVRLAMACCVVVIAADAQAEPDAIAFNESVRPIFVQHCLACHGGVKQAGGLSFVRRDDALGEGDSGVAIEPGDAEASYLIERVADPDDDYRMPPPEHGPRLTDAEVQTLREWIDQGALWDEPWAFRAPERGEPAGEPSEDDWSRTRVDRFLAARHAAEGLTPAPEADREQWLRRVTFDLIGMPPTAEQRLAFSVDDAEGAYARVVDRLLASPHFGERWASVWLDVSRYADTMGFERDPHRKIWRWRDWVVDAFNDDLPYDEFLRKQIAGDLLPDRTIADRVATAWQRNSQTNVEGGTDDEEYRIAAVVDRVDTTWQSVLGLTYGCARCHDHPYDPVSQRDYFRFFALLNSTRDADLAEDLPVLGAPLDRADEARAQQIDDEVAELDGRLHRLASEAVAEAKWRAVSVTNAQTKGATVLETREGGAEVATVGTVEDKEQYELVAASQPGPITALRIEASPKDPIKARALPEMGFAVSRLRVWIERAGSEERQELIFSDAFCDEPSPLFRPTESLRGNLDGWSVYTRLRGTRWAVFVLDQAVELGEGDRLHVTIKHGKQTDGQGALVLHRFRVTASDAAGWTEWAGDPDGAAWRTRRAGLIAQRAAIPSVRTPVLEERHRPLHRVTHLLERGNWLAPGEELAPGTPEALPGGAVDRRQLGDWLGSADNPLTARVMVNRVWAELFGVGLVATLDDFGSTGAEPTHPELLDDLAARFQAELGWSVKRLLRELALSAAYRQDARATPEAIDRDPSNRLVARGPRGRLRAEMVRDQALVLSGRFNPQIGGPPVMPYQPDGIWQSVWNNQRWETSEGTDRYRRALYTFWKRTAAYPSMIAFDAPPRDVCTAQRPTTNTPLQALVTLNDPAFNELAAGFADRMARHAGRDPRAQVAWACREAMGRDATAESLDELERLYRETLAELGDAEADQTLAATVVANVIMNLDATLSK
ncbi:MAG: PSD1 and planctomycete cytochrome C domain-containing protein [Planctomycetota bacterium]